MFITTLNLSNPTDKIEILDGQRIKITSKEQQTITLDEVEVKSRFFINKRGFLGDIILVELDSNGVWYAINHKLKRDKSCMQYTKSDIETFLRIEEWVEIKNPYPVIN